MQRVSSLVLSCTLLVAPLVLAHGDEAPTPATVIAAEHGAHAGMEMEMDAAPAVPSYFGHAHYASAVYAHIFLMVLAWVVVLPPGKLGAAIVARANYRSYHAVNIAVTLHATCTACIFARQCSRHHHGCRLQP
jgi:hypothetical protein